MELFLSGVPKSRNNNTPDRMGTIPVWCPQKRDRSLARNSNAPDRIETVPVWCPRKRNRSLARNNDASDAVRLGEELLQAGVPNRCTAL